MADPQVQQTLQKGIKAARRGHKEPAQRLLTQVVQADPSLEEAWLWLARVVDDPQQKADSLQQALNLNPDNQWAAQQLNELQQIQQSQADELGGISPIEAEAPTMPEPISGGYELEALQCPNCGAPLEIRGGEQIKTIVCDSCGSVIDLTAEQAAVIGQANKKGRALLPIQPGMEAELDGDKYQVVGWLRFEGWAEGERWRWDEWLLASAGGEFRWLTYDPAPGGGFVLQKKLPITEPIRFNHKRIAVPGGYATVSERADAKVVALAGELTWRAKVGEKIRYLDAEKGDAVYSVEISKDEVELLGGVDVPETEIWEGFKRADVLEKIEQAQSSRGGFRMLFWASLMFLVLAFCGMMCTAFSGFPILTEEMRIAQNVQGVSSERFEITQDNRLHSVNLIAENPNNDWGTISVYLRDTRENNELLFTKRFGLGDESLSHTFRPEQAGTYYLYFSLTESNISTVTVDVTVQEGIWSGRYFALFGLFIGFLAFVFYLMGRNNTPPYSHTVVRALRVQKAQEKQK